MTDPNISGGLRRTQSRTQKSFLFYAFLRRLSRHAGAAFSPRRRRLFSAAFPPYAVRCVLTPSRPRDKIFQPGRTGRFSLRSGLRRGRPGARLGPVESADHLRRQRRRFPRKRAPYRARNPEGMRLTASPPSPSLLPETFALMHRRASSDPPACVRPRCPAFPDIFSPTHAEKDTLKRRAKVFPALSVHAHALHSGNSAALRAASACCTAFCCNFKQNLNFCRYLHLPIEMYTKLVYICLDEERLKKKRPFPHEKIQSERY